MTHENFAELLWEGTRNMKYVLLEYYHVREWSHQRPDVFSTWNLPEQRELLEEVRRELEESASVETILVPEWQVSKEWWYKR